jgi:hypothetical protein
MHALGPLDDTMQTCKLPIHLPPFRVATAIITHSRSSGRDSIGEINFLFELVVI